MYWGNWILVRKLYLNPKNFLKSRKRTENMETKNKVVSNLPTQRPVIGKLSFIDSIIFRKQNPVSLHEEAEQGHKTDCGKCTEPRPLHLPPSAKWDIVLRKSHRARHGGSGLGSQDQKTETVFPWVPGQAGSHMEPQPGLDYRVQLHLKPKQK